MRNLSLVLLFLSLMTGSLSQLDAKEGVVLLHGLARTSASMMGIERFLEAEGFDCVNIGYASRSASIEKLAEQVRNEVESKTSDWDRVHFVTHSMGGILVRQMEKVCPNPKLGRVVMLAPPNHGSEIVDRVGDWMLFGAWNGPAGRQLGTADGGFIDELGPVSFELGVIAGVSEGLSFFGSSFGGPHDGKVSVESTKLEGMTGFLTVKSGHTFMMGKSEVREATARFLRAGQF